jgi:gliding motility-associated-like protein
MSIKYHLLSIIAVVLVSGGIKAQIAVQTVTPTQAVDLLVGSGVQYSNVSYTGDSLQLGSFTGANGMDFEIPAGIVLSTQAAEDIELNSSFPLLNNTVSGNADLLDIANSVPPLIGQNFSVGSANDVCILEFDFVPNGDSLVFEYIFGSDEYLEWVNSTFNDVFAFFIAGPGISGPFSAPAGFPDGSANIAFIPNTDPQVPITISSVNNVLNNSYYIDNVGVVDISLDGFTITMQAYAPVICGQTYHIRLAIADGSDTALKSIVAFQEGSFSSNGVIDVTITNPPIPNWPDNTLVEDCVFGGFEIFQSDITTADTLYVTYGGTATNGVDYELLPDVIIVPEGESSTTILLNPIFDNLVEGDEIITITFTFFNGCDQLDTAYAEVILLDETPVTLQLNNTLCVCPGDPNEVTVNVLTGILPFQYAWSNSTDQSALQLNPGDGGTYSVVVTDFCNNSSTAEVLAIDCNEYQISIETTNPPPGFPINSVIEGCLNGTFVISESNLDEANAFDIVISGTAANGTDYTSITSSYTIPVGQESVSIPIFPLSDNLAESNETITITINYVNDCGETVVTSSTMNIVQYTPLTVSLSDPTLCICPGDPNTVNTIVSTGIGPYNYAWSNSTELSTLQLNPGDAGTYNVVVTDYCNNTSTAELVAADCNAYQISIETSDAPPGFPINTVMEGCVNGTFVISESNLDEANAFNIVISGTATNGTDYTNISTSYTIPVGEESVSIPIVPLTDAIAENNETITITINYVNACGDNDIATSTMTIAQYTAMSVSIADQVICQNATITANGQPSGGVAPYEYSWTGGTSSSSLSISDYGNYSVTVTDFCDGTVTESFVISAPPVLTSALDESVFICPDTNENVNVTAAGGQAPYSYLWSTGSSASAANVDSEDAGTVSVVVTDACGSTVQDQVVVEIPTPLIAAPLVELCLDLSIGNVFSGGTEPYILIYDVDSVSVSNTYTVTVLQPGFHDVFVQDACGEIASFTVHGVVCNTIIPNIITPNGDSLNDVFRITSIDRFPNSTVMIFNRWGNMVFESTNYSDANAWDADGQSDGVYFYIFERSDGEKFEGNIQVVR